MVSLAGKTLGKYRLIEQLGRGGFASVYKAYQPRLDRYVAIKVLHPHLVEGQDFLARFEREAKAVAGLRHPNIVIVHDFEVQENTYYMVMEYVDGQSLKQRLEDLNGRGQYLSLGEVNRIMADITSALTYAHQQGMLHRDIKPSNVILNQAGQAFLTDFGIARILSGTQFTATGALIGTPAYMSPEQGQGMKVTAASDVYSLGIMLYEFITGHVPYDADTPLAIIFKHIRDPLPSVHSIRPDLPADVEKVVYKALAKDPEDRFQSPAEMMQALQATFERELQAETLLSEPGSPSSAAGWEGREKDQEGKDAQVQVPVLDDVENQDAFTEIAEKLEPISDTPTSEVGHDAVLESAVEYPPSDLAEFDGSYREIPDSTVSDLNSESAQVATLAVDANLEATRVEREQAVKPPVHEPSGTGQPIIRKRSMSKRWIIAGMVLVGIVGVAFLLFSLLRLETQTIATQAVLSATRTVAPVKTSVPTEPLPPAEEPGLAEFEQGMALMGESQNYKAALEQFNISEELGFVSPELFAHRAQACYEMRINEAGCSYEDAVRDYTRAIELDPHPAWYFDGRSWSYANIQQWPLALEDMSRAIELDPQNPDYWINRGNIYSEIEDWDQALADFNHAVEIGPDYPRSFDARARAFARDGEWEAAIRDFTAAIELDPENYNYWVARGWSHLLMEGSIEHFEAAFDDFNQALSLDAGAVGAYMGKAQAFTRQGDFVSALHELDTAIDRVPDNDRLYIEKAHILWWNLGEFEAALEALDQAIAINPENWEPFINRGEIYAYELGNPELALENFNQGVSNALPNIEAPFFARGIFYKSVEDWPAALEDLSMVIHINPDGPDAYGHRGDAFRQVGDLDAARADYHRFLELAQDNPEYAAWRSEVETWLRQNP